VAHFTARGWAFTPLRAEAAIKLEESPFSLLTSVPLWEVFFEDPEPTVFFCASGILAWGFDVVCGSEEVFFLIVWRDMSFCFESCIVFEEHK
jgi:hypothetical protein